MPTLSELAERYPTLLRGSVRESSESLDAVETKLGANLPVDLRRLLVEYGYGHCNAVPDVHQSILDTFRFRQAIGLPLHYLVLEDRNDAGAVLLDTSTSQGRVIWVDTHALDRLQSGSVKQSEMDEFRSFVEWVGFCAEEISQ